MEKDISKIEDKLKLVLEEEKGILFGYLFGSVALGKANLESDIDLAFYLLLKNTMKPISKGLLRSPYERDNPAKNLRKVATIRWIP